LAYSVGSTQNGLFLSSGFVEVTEDRVSVLADVAESLVKKSTSKRPGRGSSEAEKVLASWGGTEEAFEAEIEKLERAQARLQLAAGK